MIGFTTTSPTKRGPKRTKQQHPVHPSAREIHTVRYREIKTYTIPHSQDVWPELLGTLTNDTVLHSKTRRYLSKKSLADPIMPALPEVGRQAQTPKFNRWQNKIPYVYATIISENRHLSFFESEPPSFPHTLAVQGRQSRGSTKNKPPDRDPSSNSYII